MRNMFKRIQTCSDVFSHVQSRSNVSSTVSDLPMCVNRKIDEEEGEEDEGERGGGQRGRRGEKEGVDEEKTEVASGKKIEIKKRDEYKCEWKIEE